MTLLSEEATANYEPAAEVIRQERTVNGVNRMKENEKEKERAKVRVATRTV